LIELVKTPEAVTCPSFNRLSYLIVLIWLGVVVLAGIDKNRDQIKRLLAEAYIRRNFGWRIIKQSRVFIAPLISNIPRP
jgi:hypothetical protein